MSLRFHQEIAPALLRELIRTKKEMVYMDYEIPHTCEWEIAHPGKPSEVTDCGEPAAFFAYDDEGTGLWLCKKHLDEALEIEKERGE